MGPKNSINQQENSKINYDNAKQGKQIEKCKVKLNTITVEKDYVEQVRESQIQKIKICNQRLNKLNHNLREKRKSFFKPKM